VLVKLRQLLQLVDQNIFTIVRQICSSEKTILKLDQKAVVGRPNYVRISARRLEPFLGSVFISTAEKYGK